MHRHNSPSSVPWTAYVAFATIREIISVAWIVTLPLMWIAFGSSQPKKRRMTCAKILLALVCSKLVWEVFLVSAGHTKWYLAITSIAFMLNTIWSTLKILRNES